MCTSITMAYREANSMRCLVGWKWEATGLIWARHIKSCPFYFLLVLIAQFSWIPILWLSCPISDSFVDKYILIKTLLLIAESITHLVGFSPIKMSFLPMEKFYKMINIKLSYMSLSFNTINLNHVRIWSHEGYNIKRVAAVNI